MLPKDKKTFSIQDVAQIIEVDSRTLVKMLLQGHFPRPDLVFGKTYHRWSREYLESILTKRHRQLTEVQK